MKPNLATSNINIGHIPGRKKIALSIVSGSHFWPIAYFEKSEYADWFLEMCQSRGISAEVDEKPNE